MEAGNLPRLPFSSGADRRVRRSLERHLSCRRWGGGAASQPPGNAAPLRTRHSRSCHVSASFGRTETEAQSQHLILYEPQQAAPSSRGISFRSGGDSSRSGGVPAAGERGDRLRGTGERFWVLGSRAGVLSARVWRRGGARSGTVRARATRAVVMCRRRLGMLRWRLSLNT